MVDTIKSEITQGVIKQLGLQTGMDSVPKNLRTDAIVPVFDVKEKWIMKNYQMSALQTGGYFEFTVPAGKKIKILYGAARYVASATSGSRTIRLMILNPTPQNSYFNWVISTSLTAGSTGTYNLSPNAAEVGTGTYINLPIPRELIIPEGYRIRFYDYLGVDLSGDQWLMNLVYLESSMDSGAI